MFSVVLASAALDYFFLTPLYSLHLSREAWSYFVPFLLSALAASWMSSTRKLAHEALVDRARLVALNADIGDALTAAGTLRHGLQQCAEVAVRHLSAASARIWTLNGTTQVLELEASAGIYTRINGADARVPVGRFTIGKIAQERTPHLSNDVLNDDWGPDPEWAKQQGMATGCREARPPHQRGR